MNHHSSSARKWSYEEASTHIFRWCNSYETLEAILELKPIMSAPDWWRLLGQNWTHCDNIASYRWKLLALLRKANPTNLAAMMSNHEQRARRLLPPVVRVYRGCYSVNARGFSWSLCPAIAERFPTLSRYRRAGDKPLLITGAAERSRLVLKLDRKEREVVSTDVEVIAVISIAT